MEHARLNLITADPAHIEELVGFVDGARKRVEGELGNRGTELLSKRPLGVLIVTSFWGSGDAMRESEHGVALLRKEALSHGATVTVEHYSVPSFFRRAPAGSDASARVTRADVEPKRLEDALAGYEDTALPWLTETEGFCSAALFVHQRSGRCVAETVWRDEAALVASRRSAAVSRADVVAATDAVIRAVEEYRVEFSSLRTEPVEPRGRVLSG